MRIGLKLTAAFLVIASLVAAAGYLAQGTGREVAQQMKRLSDSAIPQMAATTEVTVALYADQLAARRQFMTRRRTGGGGASSGKAPRGRDAPDRPPATAELNAARMPSAPASNAAERGAVELLELMRSQTAPSLAPLQTAFDEHQALMSRFRVLLDEDLDAAERFLEHPLSDQVQNELLPRLAAVREQAERESTIGIRSAERALVVADQRRGMLLVAAAAAAISIGLFLSRSIGRPLGVLQRAARDIGRGRLETRVAIRSRDEIGLLAAAINQMAAELREKTVSKDRLRASLREKELLLKELHHRVKNNLQVISSLLSLQALEVRDPQMIRLFEESQARVRSMALIHEQLYRSNDLAHVNFATYVQELVDHLRQGFGGVAARVRFCLDVQPVPLLLDWAIPCGMIVNELVTNALEHAFPGQRSGEIRIAFGREDDSYWITVADNGVGMREGLAAGETAATGLKVVQALTRQIHGRLDHVQHEGTTFTIRFDRPESVSANSTSA